MILTERIKTAELIEKLDEIPLGRMYPAAFRALMRLQVYFTGRTHELMLDFGERAQGMIMRAGGKDQVLDGTSGFGLQSDLVRTWGDTWTEWVAEFQQVRREAAAIAFGVQAVYHDRLIRPVVSEQLPVVSEQLPVISNQLPVISEAVISESVADGVYDPQLRILLDVAEEYLYGDGLNLSGRIWRIDRETREGINIALLNGIQNQSSAWDIAKDLEKFLGAGQDCPRWTSTRLYGMSASEKTTSTKGLLSGKACDGSGVSYKALRLARTEVQKIHNIASDRMMAQQPWIEEEQIHLSAAHPETDICDDIVSGGRDGQGIYPKGEIALPLHPECLCRKSAVLMPEKEFTLMLNGWLKGESFPAMDRYAADLGVDLSTSLMPAAVNLAVWLFSDKLKEWLQ